MSMLSLLKMQRRKFLNMTQNTFPMSFSKIFQYCNDTPPFDLEEKLVTQLSPTSGSCDLSQMEKFNLNLIFRMNCKSCPSDGSLVPTQLIQCTQEEYH